MKRSLLAILSIISVHCIAQQKDYAIKEINFTRVKLTDKFWLPRIETNRTITIPASFQRCENTGRVRNFLMAAEKKENFAQGTLSMIRIYIKRSKEPLFHWQLIPIKRWMHI